MATHTLQLTAIAEWTSHNGISFVNGTTAETATFTGGVPISIEASPSDVISFNNVVWGVEPVAGDSVNAVYNGTGNYVTADGQALPPFNAVMVNCLDIVPIADDLFDIPDTNAGDAYSYAASQNFTEGGTPDNYIFVDSLGNPYGSEVVTFQVEPVTFQGETVTF